MTSIGLDHVEDLGPTLRVDRDGEGGRFPRGPARADASSREPGVAVRVPRRGERDRGAAPRDGRRDARRGQARRAWKARGSGWRRRGGRYELETPLAGPHQVENAAIGRARGGAPAARDRRRRPSRGASRPSRWPGRLEVFRVRGATVLLDGCHNADGAEALAAFLADARLAAGPRLRRDGRQGRRSDGGRARPRRSGAFASCRWPRRAPPRPEELVRRVRAPRGRTRAAAPEPRRRRSKSCSRAPRGETIIVAGSLYLVGEARALLAGRRDEKR